MPLVGGEMATHLIDDYATVQSHWRQKEVGRRVDALSDILKLAHAPEDENAQEAAVKLYEFLNNLNDDELAELTQEPTVAGPLAHCLARLMMAKNRNVLLYCSRTLKTLMRDPGSRVGLCKAGLARSISATLQQLQIDMSAESGVSSLEIQKELFGAAQNILFDKACAPDFAANGGLKTVGEIIGRCFAHNDIEQGGGDLSRFLDAEIRLLVLACACNALSYCDTSLSDHIHEMRSWIDPICKFLATSSRLPDSESEVQYAICSLANATRDPGLTHAVRSANGAEILDRCRHRNPNLADVAGVAYSRLQVTSSLRNDLDRIWRFRWGMRKSSSGMKSNEVLGLLAFLLIVSVIAGFIILAILHFSNF